MADLDWCDGSWSTLDDLSHKICVPNKRKDVNLSFLNMVTRINQSKTIRKYTPWKCKLNI